MKKFLLSFLCSLLAVAGGYAEEVTYNVTSTSAVSLSGDAPQGSSATYSSTYSTKCQLTGGNSMTLTLSGFAGNKITGLKMSMKSNTSKGAGNFLAKVGDTAISEIATANFNATSWAGKWSTSYIDVTPTMNVTDREVNDGENIVITIAATVNSLYCQSFTIMYEPVGGGSVTPIAPSAPILKSSCSFDNEMSVEITNNSAGSTIYYTIDGTDPSSSNGTEYTVPFKITETTTVKAIAVNEAGSSDIVEVTYTKNKIVDGIANDILTFDKIGITVSSYSDWSGLKCVSSAIYAGQSASSYDAIQLRSATDKGYSGVITTTSGGKVKKIVVVWNGSTSSGRTLDVYGKNTAYSSPTELYGSSTQGTKLGSIKCGTSTELVIDGNYAYIGLRSNSGAMYLDSITIVWDTSTTPVAPTITFDGEATFEDAKVVTITAAEGTAIYYTLDGSEPNNNSDECPETITLKADATLKVIAYDEDGDKSDIVEQKFTLASSGSAESSTGTATLVTDVADLVAGDQVVIVASGNDVALSTTQNNNNRDQVAITKEGDNVTLKDGVQVLTLEAGTVENTYAFFTGSGYLYAASSTNNHLKTQTTNNDNGSWKIDIAANGVATIKAQGTNTRNLLRYNSASNGQLFSCYGSGQDDVSLYEVIKGYVLNVTEVGWATLYLDYAVAIPTNVTCYVASKIGEESVQLKEVTDVLPAKTAVIVKADKGTYTFVASGTEETVNSLMEGTAENEYITEEAYVLANGDDGVALYKVVMNGGVFLNNANKAYLPASALPQTLNAKALKFNFDTTGVEGVKVETEGKKVIYDLSGRRVNDMTAPGLYIVNGKKVMVK